MRFAGEVVEGQFGWRGCLRAYCQRA
jgi:hypothetical protein